MEAHIAEVTETTSQVWDRGQSASVKAAARRPLPRVTTLAISAGILVCATGFGLIAFTWSRVAGTLNVALQLPFFVSGGLTGLGLILVGLTVVSIAAKQREALTRTQHLNELREAIRELRAALREEGK